tara:strand:- start:17428 stop:17964 length:537 start_codon:yes stop_codon:yes gene_type:complete
MRSIDTTPLGSGGGHLPRLLFFCWLSIGPASGALAQEMLVLSFSEGVPEAGSYSTREAPTLSVVDGQTVILERASGRDYQLQASDAEWTWTQVQQVPRTSSSLKITPNRRADEVQLELAYASKDGDDTLAYTTTVTGKLGEWIPLLSTARQSSDAGGRHYSTAAQARDLAVKVQLAAP